MSGSELAAVPGSELRAGGVAGAGAGADGSNLALRAMASASEMMGPFMRSLRKTMDFTRLSFSHKATNSFESTIWSSVV